MMDQATHGLGVGEGEHMLDQATQGDKSMCCRADWWRLVNQWMCFTPRQP